jgi:hypothetical protein
MPTPENLVLINNKQRPLNRQLRRGKTSAVDTFQPVQTPTTVGFSLAEVNMRRIGMVVREEEDSIAFERMSSNAGVW